MLKPFEAMINAIKDKTTTKYLDNFKKLIFESNFKKYFPSTITKLDIALTKVSTVLIVRDIASTIIIIDKILVWSLSKIEKKAMSGFTSKFCDIAMNSQLILSEHFSMNDSFKVWQDDIYNQFIMVYSCCLWPHPDFNLRNNI